MNFLRIAFLTQILALITPNLKAQPTTTSEKLVFEKIIYHSTHCNGTCPQIDLEIDSSNDVLLKREIWNGKGVVDNHRSG
jgi:hypothetical protein